MLDATVKKRINLPLVWERISGICFMELIIY
jgi:hypothetical protein